MYYNRHLSFIILYLILKTLNLKSNNNDIYKIYNEKLIDSESR